MDQAGRGETKVCPGVNIPADNNVIVKQVNFDVLDSDGLVEALRDQQPQKTPQVWSVVQRNPHLRREALQQRQKHGPRVNLPCVENHTTNIQDDEHNTQSKPAKKGRLGKCRQPRDPRV